MIRSRLLLGAALAAAAACGDATSPHGSAAGAPALAVSGSVTASRVDIATTATLAVGASATFPVEVYDLAGRLVVSPTIAWSTSDPAVLTVDAAGRATGRATGLAWLNASSGGVTSGVRVTVAASQPASRVDIATSGTLAVGASTTFPVAVFDLAGQRVASPLIAWSTSNPAVLTVDANGLVSGRAAGTALLTASSGGIYSSMNVTVTGGTVAASRVDLAVVGTVAVGASTTFPVTVYDLAGRIVTAPVVTWASTNPAVLSVDASGLATGRAQGSAVLVATSGGTSAWMNVTVGAPAQQTPVQQQAGDVVLTLRRFAAGSGTVRASGGIPLPPGRLRPVDLPVVSVYVAGREVPIYVEALAGRHPDGSLRSVYVELDADLSTEPVAGLLRLGARRLAGDLAAGSRAARGLPAAAVLPASADYLVSTGIVGRTLTAARTSALGGAFGTWEGKFAPLADRHWAAEGAQWYGNYYDRAHLYFAAWARTGNPEYFRRAAAIAVAYRRDYIEASGYGPSAHWWQPDGLADHYLLTGDEASRTAVGRVGDLMAVYVDRYLGNSVNNDNRIQARVLSTLLVAKRIDATGRSATQWGALLDVGVDKVLGMQRADGSFRFDVTCYESLNYQAGMLNDALVRVHDYHRADWRIMGAVRRSLDFLWNTQVVGSPTVAFKYVSGICPGVGDQTPAPDLNGLMVTAFGWMYRETGEVTFRDRGDAIFGGINAAWLDGSKQFNQSYSQSYNYLGYR